MYFMKGNTLIFRENGSPASLSHLVHQGSNANLWHMQGSKNCIAKIYHNTPLRLGQKLEVMIGNPPADPFNAAHQSFAWPIGRLFNKDGHCCGFFMPSIPEAPTLTHICQPKSRTQLPHSYNWYIMHTVARNISALVHALHSHNYTIGSFSPNNIFVYPNGMLSWVGLDDIQVHTSERILSGHKPSIRFTSPEYQRQPQTPLQRTHDLFALPTLLHLILMGHHPFAHTTNENLEACIFKGDWLGRASSPPSFTPPYKILDPSIAEGFHQVFDTPDAAHRRPKPAWWGEVTSQALTKLDFCPTNASHFFLPPVSECPWCTLKRKTSFESFPHKQDAPSLPALLQALDSRDWQTVEHLTHTYAALQNIPLSEQRVHSLKLCRQLANAYQHFQSLSEPITAENTPKLWLQYAETHEISKKDIPHFPFADLLPAHTAHRDAINNLAKICKRLENDMVQDPYVCEQIVTYAQNLEEKGAIPSLYPDLRDHIERAKTVVGIWSQLLKAVHTQNDVALGALHQEHHKQLKTLTMPQSYQQALQMANKHKENFEHLNTLIQNKAPHATIYHELQKFPDLLNSSFCHEKLSNDVTLSQFEDLLKRKHNIQHNIERSVKNEDFLTIHRLWDPLFQEGVEPWKTAATYAHRGKRIAQTWSVTKRAILEKDISFLRNHWSEKLFASAVQHEGLQQATQDAVRLMYKNTQFPSSPLWPLCYIQKGILHVIFAWPTCDPLISHCLILWNTKHHPRSIIDTSNNDISLCTTRPKGRIHHVCIPLKEEKVFVSIWPATTIAHQIIPIAPPLHTQSLQNTYILYREVEQKGEKALIISSPHSFSNITLYIVTSPNTKAPQTIAESYFEAIHPYTPVTMKLPDTENLTFALLGRQSYGEPVAIFKEIS